MERPARARCKQFNERLTRNAILRRGSPVDDLVAFCRVETGRAADPSLKNAALCLYFVSERIAMSLLRSSETLSPSWSQRRCRDRRSQLARLPHRNPLAIVIP